MIRRNHKATCQWIEGESHERKFCGKPVCERPRGPSSYCEDHHKVVFQPVKEKPADKDDAGITAGMNRLARSGLA